MIAISQIYKLNICDFFFCHNNTMFLEAGVVKLNFQNLLFCCWFGFVLRKG
jgi:hypothetical protein